MSATYPWSLQRFREERSAIYKFCQKYREEKNLIVSAPVKSGKRQMVECFARLEPNKRHFFVSALNRKDSQEQRTELETYGITVETRKHRETLRAVQHELKHGTEVVIHLDESDYGTGSKQRLKSLIWKLYEHQEQGDRIILRLYSATNYEAECSEFAKIATVARFDPGPDYFGAEQYLKAGLVEKSRGPGWEKGRFSPQMVELLQSWAEAPQDLFILRLPSNSKHCPEPSKAELVRELQKYVPDGDVLQVGTKYNDVHWGHLSTCPSGRIPISRFDRGIKTLVVIKQTATRSTELAVHDRIFAMYDHRWESTSTATYEQAILRVVHYRSSYPKDRRPRIRVVCDPEVFEVAAGRKSVMSAKRRPSSRVSRGLRLRRQNREVEKVLYFPIADYEGDARLAVKTLKECATEEGCQGKYFKATRKKLRGVMSWKGRDQRLTSEELIEKAPTLGSNKDGGKERWEPYVNPFNRKQLLGFVLFIYKKQKEHGVGPEAVGSVHNGDPTAVRSLFDRRVAA